MPNRTVFFANIYTPDSYSAYHEVADEKEAVQKSIALKAHFFQTVTMKCQFAQTAEGEKFISGLPGTESSRCYTNVDKIFTARGVVGELDTVLALPELQGDDYQYFRASLNTARDTYNAIADILDQHPSFSPAYILNPVFRKASRFMVDYIPVSQDEQIFDTTGQQLWPPIAAPQPARSPDHSNAPRL